MMRLFLMLLICALVIPVCAALASPVWVEDSFEDFRDGTFDSSGENLYVTKAGHITTVHRFDFNSDGYQDLVFNSSHDFVTAPKPTVYALPKGRGEGKLVDLPVFGTTHANSGDFNKDGYIDLVLTPNNDWVSSNARRYAFVMWGGKDGWSSQRMTNLIDISPTGVEVGDMDGDGWEDLIFMTGCRWAPEDGSESMLRIYWGSEEGFRMESRREIIIGSAYGVTANDLDGDGREDLAVVQYPMSKGEREKNAVVEVYWGETLSRKGEIAEPSRIPLNTGSVSRLKTADLNADGRLDLVISGGVKEVIGRDPTTGEERYRYGGIMCLLSEGKRGYGSPVSISAPSASSLELADVNGDRRPDAILANSSAKENGVTILWGQSNGLFDASKAATLPIGRASATASADFDGDGNSDVAVGVYQTETTYQADSRIFYGDGKGGFTLSDTNIPTAGVNNVISVPEDSGSGYRLVFCNNIWGRINEDVPVYVYWGVKGGFDPKKASKYHISSGYCSNCADLNDDGYPDLILASIVHNVAGANPERGFNILWGGKDGLKDDRRTTVQEYAMTASNVADVDKDGYLDLIGSCNRESDKGEPSRMVIWHGGDKGFDPARRLALPCAGVNGPNVVADYNKDGWLDIAVSRGLANRISIFWNSPTGFDAKRESSLPLMAADDMQTADLNADGWLDLIATSYYLEGTMHYDVGTYIFWGSPKGFSATNAQRLRTSAGCGISVADYDKDGYLDMNIPNYKWSDIREAVQSFLFWGSKNGFSDHEKSTMLVDSGHATQSADFNGDGLIDLAISCHSLDGDHWVNSRVYYNDGRRFLEPKLQILPTCGPHYMNRADVGNQYDRSYRQTYVSSAYSWAESETSGSIKCSAKIPGKTKLNVSIRSAATSDALDSAKWSEVKGGKFKVRSTDRYLQYKADFISDNGDRYPVLDRVELRLNK